MSPVNSSEHALQQTAHLTLPWSCCRALLPCVFGITYIIKITPLTEIFHISCGFLQFSNTTLCLYQYISIIYYKSATYFNDCIHWNASVCVLLHFSHILKNCCIIFNIFLDSNSSVMGRWWLLQFTHMSEWHHIKCNKFISILLNFCYMLKKYHIVYIIFLHSHVSITMCYFRYTFRCLSQFSFMFQQNHISCNLYYFTQNKKIFKLKKLLRILIYLISFQLTTWIHIYIFGNF